MIAWASTGSSLEITVSVGPGGHLDWQLPPLIASSSCRFSQLVKADLAAGATMRWAEEVVLGRHGEAPGRLSLRLDVNCDGAPLLRHQLELGPGVPGWDGPAVLGANRAAALVLVAGGAPTTGTTVRAASPPTAGPGWAVMALEGPGSLVSAVGPDLLSMRSALAQALSGQGG
jgi:urease accessory protein